jgi:hypothetical protein
LLLVHLDLLGHKVKSGLQGLQGHKVKLGRQGHKVKSGRQGRKGRKGPKASQDLPGRRLANNSLLRIIRAQLNSCV